MKKTNVLFRLIFVAALGLALTACEGPFHDYSNYDLQQENAKCQRGGHSGAGAQRCANVEKECEKRKAEKGFRC